MQNTLTEALLVSIHLPVQSEELKPDKQRACKSCSLTLLSAAGLFK